MEAQETLRLNQLTNPPMINSDFLYDYYGIRLDDLLDSKFKNELEFWILNDYSGRQNSFFESDSINRILLELFLSEKKLLPIKFAAARLGMTKDSLLTVLGIMHEKKYLMKRDWNSELPESQFVIKQEIIEKFWSYFPNLKYVAFRDHDNYCNRIQSEISKILSFDPEPLFCATSKCLGQDPKDFAYSFCILSTESIGIRYSVWLDFRKPAFLDVDRCSLKFYAQYEAELENFLLGRKPENTLVSQLRA